MTLGPEHGSVLVSTTAEGVGKGLGHDLVLVVKEWEATVEGSEDGRLSAVTFEADPGSLSVRDATGGAKPLSDDDRLKIATEAERKVLGGEPIVFRSTSIAEAEGRTVVTGELSLAGQTRPLSVPLEVSSDARVRATFSLTHSEWGIKPYSALLGALRVGDAVEIAIDVRLPPG